MVRRLTPLVLAILIAFAPAAVVFCEASCAGHAPAAPTVHHAAHHHHESPERAATVAVSHHAHYDVVLAQLTTGLAAASHRCTHADGLPVAGGVALTAAFPPAVLPVALVLPGVPTAAVSLQDIASGTPPHPLALITQLRI